MTRVFDVVYRAVVTFSLLFFVCVVSYGYFVPSAVAQWVYEVDHAYWAIYDQNCVVNNTACIGD